MELTRSGVENELDRTEGEVGELWRCDETAAAENPKEDLMEEKVNRRKAEENRLAVVKE